MFVAPLFVVIIISGEVTECLWKRFSLMSGGPRVRSMNVAEPDKRPVLVPAGNKARNVESRKPVNKSQRKVEKSLDVEGKDKRAQLSPPVSPPFQNCRAPSILRSHGSHLLQYNLSLNASCSSDASSDSSQSRASTGRINSSVPIRRKQCAIRLNKVLKTDSVEKVATDHSMLTSHDGSAGRKRCAWVTPNTDLCYAAFHDEEWGVPVHDDNKLFELLSLSSALAELTWPTILNRRDIFREMFSNFDPRVVSKLNERKLAISGSYAVPLLSEIKLRGIIENARLICQIIDEYGSFDKYIWDFVGQKPVVSRFRYPRQVAVKTPKAEVISKDLVRRGLRGVGPTVVYSFMQAAGLTNDHLVSCFRFQECLAVAEAVEKDVSKANVEGEKYVDGIKLDLVKALDEMSICSDL